MRILIINSEYPPIGGGAGNASANLARELVILGHELVVITVRFNTQLADEVYEGVRVIRVRAKRRHADRSGALEQLIFIFAGALGALRLIRRWKPDVTLAFFGMPGGAVALAVNLLFGVPYIVSLRGGDVPGFRPYDFALYHKLISPLLKIIWRKAEAVVANSGGLRSLAQFFERTVPIQIIPNGVDPETYIAPERDWSYPKVLFVGRIVYQKGLDLLLHALGSLIELPWELTIVGDGPQKIPLQTLADKLDIDNRVKFIGWKRDVELLAQFAAANIFLHPSRHEGMPNAVLEAMASGIPVIASRIAGNEELVIHNETGILVEPEHQQSLENGLRVLLGDPLQREKMGRKARKRVIEHYTWKQTAARYEELLKRVGLHEDTTQ